MADTLEEYITLKLRGLEDAPRQLQETIAQVKALQTQLDALHKTQGALEKQFGSATPQQQPQLQKQLNTLSYQIDQAVNKREVAQGAADTAHTAARQYAELAKRVQFIEQKRTTTPPTPGPAENLSPSVMLDYATAAGELDHAQAKFKRARTDNSRQKWAGEIDRLQSQLENLPSELTRVAYEEPLKEIRRRVQNMTQQGRSVGNRDFAQIERDVSQGRLVTPEDDAALSARRIQAMAKEPGFGGRLLSRMKENVSGEWGAINLAYAAQEGGQAVSQYAALNMSGRRVTPEEQARAAYGFLPAVGGAVGALFGGWPGSLVGGGVGTGVAGVLSAQSERGENVRLASEQIAAALGTGATGARQFAEQLEDASKRFGTPVVELAQSVAKAQSVLAGTMTAGGVDYQARLQAYAGDLFPQISQSVLRAAQQPGASRIRQGLLTGDMPQGALLTSSFLAGIRGDVSGMHDLQMAAGLKEETPAYADAKSREARLKEINSRTFGILGHWTGPALDRVRKQERGLEAGGKAFQVTPGEVSARQNAEVAVFTDAGYDVQTAGAYARIHAAQGGYALASGKGAAGLAGPTGQEIAELHSQRASILAQMQILRSEASQPGADQRQLKSELTSLAGQLQDVSGQALGARVGLFQAGLSEQEVAYGSTTGRLSLMGQRYALSGLSVDDGRTAGVYARQRATELAEAARLTKLANDYGPGNFLRPEEREADRTQAMALRLQATTGQRTEIFNRGQQEQAARNALRMSQNDAGLAQAQTGGSTSDVYAAQQAELTENLRQQKQVRADIATMEQQGIGTYGQKLGLQTQLNGLIAQEARTRQQVTEAAYASLSGQMADVSRGAAAIGGQERFAGGTTTAYYGAAGAGLDAQAARVTLLKQQADTTTDPKKKAGFIADYQEAALQLKNDTVAKLGVYEESPQDQFKRINLEGQARRMAMSPYVPGSRLSVQHQQQEQDARRLAGIQAQMTAIARSNRPEDDKQRAINSLAQQQQDVQNDMTERASTIAESMFSNRIANSVNSPSFYSRIGPSDSDAARAAERVGLGAQSARVFGYSRHQSYRDTMNLGFAAPDENLVAFGKRPGDLDGGTQALGGMARGVGGAAPAGGDLHGAIVTLTHVMDTLAKKGFTLRVETTNPSTGQKASQTVNATRNSDSTAIQRGGAGR